MPARSLTKLGLISAVALVALALPPQRLSADAKAPAGPSADQALKMLQDGNARFVSGKLEHPNESAERRTEVAKGQHPYAVVLACADSRVGPEVIFDAGLGDLFVTRVAGNVVDDAMLGSIEYAIDHLGTPLVVVCGHQRCGAVQAAVDTVAAGTPPPGHLAALIDPIRPAVTAQKPGDDLMDRAVDANVRNMVAKINADEEVAHLVHEGKVKVVGGRYNLDTGEFKILDTAQASAKPSDELM